MKIILSEKTREAVQFALDEAAKMYAGNIGDSVDEICHRLCLLQLMYLDETMKNTLNLTVTKGSKNLSEKDSAKEVSETFFTEDFKEENIGMATRMLDLVLRIALGQWDQLYMVQRTIDNGNFFLNEEDRLIVDAMRNEYFGAETHFGIGSTTLSDEVRMIYDLYKVLMYENGTGGVYNFQPYALSDEVLPTVYLTPVKTWDIKKPNDVERILEELSDTKHADLEGYFQISDHMFAQPRVGETLILKKNSLFSIVKAKTEN